MSGTVLGAGDITVNKTVLVPALAEVIFQDGLGKGAVMASSGIWQRKNCLVSSICHWPDNFSYVTKLRQ